MTSSRSSVLAMALLAAALTVTFLVYLPGLSGPLLLDDIPQLDNLIKQGAVDPGSSFRNYIVSGSGPSGRPIAMATFIIDAISHGPDIWWWKYGNVMFHMISGLLVFWLTALLCQASPRQTDLNPWVSGAIVAGLWLLHPLHVSTVLYTVQRMTELSTLFVLAGLVCYVKGRLIQAQSSSGGWLLIIAGFLFFYPLAIFSKENALIYPAFCSLIELLILQFRGPSSLARQVKLLHVALLAGYLAIGITLIANFSSLVLEAYEVRDFTLSERLLTQFRVIIMYLSMLMLPIQRNMGFFHDDIVVSTGLFEPFTTGLSALAMLAIVASTVALRRKLPLYAFGVLFYFVSHVMESSIFALELMFEHRNYLGSVGLLIAAVSIGLSAKKYRRGLAFLVAICLVGLSLLTWQRSITWSSPNNMHDYMYRVHPESSRLSLVAAESFAAANDLQRARQYLDKVKPGIGVEMHRLYFDCLEKGSVTSEAVSRLFRLQDQLLDTYAASTTDSLVNEVVSGRCDAPRKFLVDLIDHILSMRSRSSTERVLVLFTKADLLESMGDVDGAVEQYMAAYELSDNTAISLYKAAATLVRAGKLDAARSMLVRGQEVEKDRRIKLKEIAKRLYSGLGEAYEKEGRLGDALVVYEEAVRSMPTETLYYLKTAYVLLSMKRYEDAGKVLEDIRTRDLADLDEYDYAVQRIATELERRKR